MSDYIVYYENELQHHGILGQKWGVRRFQNKDGTLTSAGRAHRRLGNGKDPIEDTVLKAGTRLNSVSSTKKSEEYRKDPKPMYTYNPDDDWDRKVYTGPFTFYKRFYTGAPKIYEHQYETVKDLKMPTSKERVDEFLKLYNDKKTSELVKADLKNVQDYMKLVWFKGNENVQGVNVNKLKTESDKRAAYEIFNHAMEAAHQFKSTRAYMNVMSTKYDAMVDDNNQRVYNAAHDPVIIFKTDEALRTIGKVRLVKDREMRRNIDEVREELTRQGEKLKY